MRQRRLGKPFPEHEVRRMIRQVLNGDQDDARPRHHPPRRSLRAHVLLAASGDVKIGGFGQAICVSEEDDVVDPCQKTMWDDSAPEALLKGRGARESELLDSWSIGCLMAELLTGKPLFAYGDRCDEILDVLGIPDKGDLEDIKPQDLGLAQEMVREWRARQPFWNKIRGSQRTCHLKS